MLHYFTPHLLLILIIIISYYVFLCIENIFDLILDERNADMLRIKELKKQSFNGKIYP